MSYSIGRMRHVVDVQDEMIIKWDEIGTRILLDDAFIVGEEEAKATGVPANEFCWDKIAPGLWLLTAGGDNTGIMIAGGRDWS